MNYLYEKLDKFKDIDGKYIMYVCTNQTSSFKKNDILIIKNKNSYKDNDYILLINSDNTECLVQQNKDILKNSNEIIGKIVAYYRKGEMKKI